MSECRICDETRCVVTPDVDTYGTLEPSPRPPAPPTPSLVPNDQVVYSTSCESYEVLTFTGTLPAWITFNATTNQVFGAAGTFYRTTKSAANAAAQDALNLFVLAAFAAGDFECFGFPCMVARWAADEIVASDGDALAQWNDTTGNGHHLTQSVAANQPIYKTNQINTTKPVVRFGTTAAPAGVRWFDVPAFFLGPPQYTQGEIFMVIRAEVDPSNPTGSKVGFMKLGGGSLSFYAYQGKIWSDFGVSSGRQNTPDLGGILDNWNVVDINSQTGQYAINVNGASQALTPGPDYTIGWSASGHSFIGQSEQIVAGPSFDYSWFYGDIAEILFFECILEAADRANVLAYLQTKYGL